MPNFFALVCIVTLVSVMIGTSYESLAITPDEILSDPVLESRARAISKSLRCMICQGQTIDESNVSFARDIRMFIRNRLIQGDSTDQITAYLVDRYGQYILMQPTLQGKTILLWSAPVFLLGIGLILIRTYFRSLTSSRAPSYSLSTEEQHYLTSITDQAFSKVCDNTDNNPIKDLPSPVCKTTYR